ncbi:DUF6148 family protein [Lysinibacillus sp. NPDC047702]|uniref:DUF6148 family protein n=1 Tax=unclassified Lysinibacillus TaxID=2636778 RepID=UPI003D03E614
MTLERARVHLQSWLDAELAISTAQSYSVGSRTLTRANLSEVRKQIDYWRNKVAELEITESGRKVHRSKRFMPRDL